MVRIGQRFELLDAAGKKPGETFSPDQLGAVRAVLAAGGSRLGADTIIPGHGRLCHQAGDRRSRPTFPGAR
jgi:hypothetical protein